MFTNSYTELHWVTLLSCQVNEESPEHESKVMKIYGAVKLEGCDDKKVEIKVQIQLR